MKIKLLTIGMLTFMAGVSAASAANYSDITKATLTVTPQANSKVVVQVIPETVSVSLTNNQKLGTIDIIPVGNTITRIGLSDGGYQHNSLNSTGKTMMSTADGTDGIKVATSTNSDGKLVAATVLMPSTAGGSAFGGGITHYYEVGAGKSGVIGVFSAGAQIASAQPHLLNVEAATYTP